ncbi:MAG: DNA replication and repair protein RecF [Treponemataceae bacterium]|nr:MAG: DNA replication and repair protein RecF [Treponemataceae bacterium]
MPFLSLATANYRNIEDGTIDIHAKQVFFVGENGQGKSNILEALYCLSYGASYRTKKDSEMARHGADSFSLRALYSEENGSTQSVAVYYENGKKKILKNAKRLMDRKALINTIPCVLYSHEDLMFVDGEPERRRFFLDQTLSMYDASYIDIQRQYRKTLKSRNLCLKNRIYDLLDTYDMQLAKSGTEIQKRRKKTIFSFNLIFTRLYEQVTGIENVRLVYKPSWGEQSASGTEEYLDITEEEAAGVLREKRDIDKQLGASCYGPHRDRIIFVKDGRNFIQTASTGQRRTVAILLRTAQAEFYKNNSQKKPVLLFDDVLLELDPEKRAKITDRLPDYDQIFFTFLPEEPYMRYRKAEAKGYIISKGRCFSPDSI